MKKVLFIIVILALVFGAVFYGTKDNATPTNPDLVSYRNSRLGISFTYPKILTASTTKNVISLHHEVPFVHHDYCDFKGEGDTTINTLTDFRVSFYTVDKSLIDSMRQESPYIPEENFVDGNIIPSPGFIDSYENGELKGFRIFEGAEGCGHLIYYLKISEKKTLIVIDEFITVFSGAIDTENMDRALAVPGVINKNRASEIFESVLKTVKVD